MQKKTSSFKLSNEELKKINYMMPKGYKLVQRQEIIKKDLPPKPIKKKVLPPPIAIVAANPTPSKIRYEKVKQEEYQPNVIVKVPTLITAPPIPPNQQPAGTSPKLFERIKRHPVFHNLMKISKMNESDISLRQIETKVISDPDNYRILDLQNDIQNFCLMLYKSYAKASTQYKQAAELQNYLANLMKVQNNHLSKKIEPVGLQRGVSSQQLGNIRKKIQPVNRNIYQPIAESKLPTPAEKRALGQMIKKLPSDSLQQVCYIVFESTQNRDYIFDLDTLHVKKFRELQEFVKKYMQKFGEWEQRNYEDEQFSNQSFFVIDDDQ